MPGDRTPHDTASGHPTRRVSARANECVDCLMLIFDIMLVAPAELIQFPFPPPTDSARLGFWRDHVEADVIAGLTSIQCDSCSGVAYAQSVEVLTHGIFGEVRFEQGYHQRYVRYQTVRVGRLWHAAGPMAGGITVGHRAVRGATGQEGVEIGFPLVLGGARSWARFQTGYVLTSSGVNWNYLIQAEWPLRHTPLRAGFTVEAVDRPLRLHGSHLNAFTIAGLLGWRR